MKVEITDDDGAVFETFELPGQNTGKEKNRVRRAIDEALGGLGNCECDECMKLFDPQTMIEEIGKARTYCTQCAKEKGLDT